MTLALWNFRNDKVILKANYNKAKKILKWRPTITFKSLVKEMVEYDLKNQIRVKKDIVLKESQVKVRLDQVWLS